MSSPMSRFRAGRTAGTVRGSAQVLPQPPASRRQPFQSARRRAALASTSGHRIAEAVGFDGDVCVRYEAVYRRAEPACGERRLLLAVLEDGIRTLLKNAQARHGRAGNLRREALIWVCSEEHGDVFAFNAICEALGIDPVRLRGRVLMEAGLSVPPPMLS